MPDVFTPAKRSAVMALIRGSGNKATELRLIALFHAHGITGWRRKQRLFGKPDFVFLRERIAVFVDGCFWHGCPKPKHAPLPKNRAEWWEEKLTRNKARDSLVSRELRKRGWTVLRVWECGLTRFGAGQAIARIKRALTRNSPSPSRNAAGRSGRSAAGAFRTMAQRDSSAAMLQ